MLSHPLIADRVHVGLTGPQAATNEPDHYSGATEDNCEQEPGHVRSPLNVNSRDDRTPQPRQRPAELSTADPDVMFDVSAIATTHHKMTPLLTGHTMRQSPTARDQSCEAGLP